MLAAQAADTLVQIVAPLLEPGGFPVSAGLTAINLVAIVGYARRLVRRLEDVDRRSRRTARRLMNVQRDVQDLMRSSGLTPTAPMRAHPQPPHPPTTS